VTQFLSYAIPGLPYGCVFALMAVGLVLTYQTSGVFNLAYGAQAYASALIFYVCVNAGWPSWAAFLAAVVVVAPLLVWRWTAFSTASSGRPRCSSSS